MKNQNRFVLQEHSRGQSSHIDLRLEEGDHLIGFTLDDPGRVGNKTRLSNNSEKSSKNKILAHLKNIQPKEFLELKGNLTEDETSKLRTLDKGTFKTGVVKDNLLELFLQGNKYNGRFVVSKLKEDWFFWKPIKQTPSVLSSESIEKGFVPPQGKSALPKEWEDMIPATLRWWEKNWTGTRALITLKEIRKSLLKRKVLKQNLIQFNLGKNKEQIILRIGDTSYFELNENPLIKKENIKAIKKYGNVQIETLDSGKIEVIEQNEDGFKLKFMGQKLQGFWTFKRKGNESILEKTKEETNPKKIQNIPLSDEQIGTITRLTLEKKFPSEIADKALCSKQSVIYWQKKMGMR